MTYKSTLQGLKLIAPLDLFAEVGLCRRKNRTVETASKKRIVVQVGMYFVA